MLKQAEIMSSVCKLNYNLAAKPPQANRVEKSGCLGKNGCPNYKLIYR